MPTPWPVRTGRILLWSARRGRASPSAKAEVAFSTRKLIGLSATGDPIRMQSIPLTPISILRHDRNHDGNIEGDVLWLTFMATPTQASAENPRVPGKPMLLRGTKDSSGAARVPGRKDHVIAFRLRTSQGLALLRATHFDADEDEDGLPNHWEKAGGGVDADRDGMADLNLNRMGADPPHKDLFLEIDWLPARMTGYPGGWENRISVRSIFALAEVFANAPLPNPDGSPGIRLHMDAGRGADAEGILLTAGRATTNMADYQGGDEVRPRGLRPDVIHTGEAPSAPSSAFAVASMDEVKAGVFGSREKNAREFAFRYAVLGDFHNMLSEVPGEGGDVVYARVNGITGNTLTLALNVPVAEARVSPILAQEWIGIAISPAAGQIRPWNKTLPTTLILDGSDKVIGIRMSYSGPVLSPRPDTGSDVYFFNGSTGLAEGFTRDLMDPESGVGNLHRLGGNNLLISMANFAINSSDGIRQQRVGRTLAHDLGHNLGLAHGGRDGRCSRRGGVHWSLMSYSHQLRLDGLDFVRIGGTGCGLTEIPIPPPIALVAQTTPPGLVTSFSNGLDPHGFNEWDYVRLETWSVPWFLGNSRMRCAGALPPLHPGDEAGPLKLLDSSGACCGR